jgi:IS605 OrfB family transposase
MLIRKAFKYRLNTSVFQEKLLLEFSGANRFVWNKALALQTRRLERHEKEQRRILSYNELAMLLKLWKQSDEWSFLKDTPSQTLQQTLKDLDKAVRDAFNPRQSLKKFPVFKKKHESKGFRFPQNVKVRCNQVFIPKIGWIGFRNSRKLKGMLKNMTISERNGKWYVAIQVEMDIKETSHFKSQAIGIDLGITKTVTLSNGTVFQGAKSFRKYREKLAKAQRLLARKTKFSQNWKKQKSKIGQIHEIISNTRQDRNHWISSYVTRNFNEIYAEDLKIKNLTKSAKRTVEEPGRMVKQKSGLNREILDQGWHELCRQLAYKSDWSGNLFGQVDPKYTSQKCSNSQCGHRAKENRESQATFLCKKCGHTENADINAAKNILATGRVVFACGGETLVTPLKQEPLAA